MCPRSVVPFQSGASLRDHTTPPHPTHPLTLYPTPFHPTHLPSLSILSSFSFDYEFLFLHFNKKKQSS
ncbi:hypothetical protein L1987_36256 [Smallanthus sonchifolius]|uniref:Uncharacterized protein n=1 Tax=Smallanthus sonchifolius TaxID=185202 RepID=A0ACB9HE83_9ASTR|nr:hypothetical protein L1987_36256 [Smallanthus sonchifolius]